MKKVKTVEEKNQILVCVFTLALLLFIFIIPAYSSESNGIISYVLPKYEGKITDSVDLAFIKSNHHIGRAGEPDIPWFYGAFLVPEDADYNNISVVINDVKKDTIDLNNKLSTVQDVIILGDEEVLRKDDYFLNYTSGLFPETDIEILGFSNLYGNKIIRFRVPLAFWDLEKRKLITTNGGILQVKLNATKNIIVKNCPKSAFKRLSKTVLNFPHDLLNSRLSSRQTEGYIIFTTNTIKNNLNNLEAFVASKRAKGYNVEVVTDWGRTSEEIRSWLSSRYISENIAYALMIGDGTPTSGDVPMYAAWSQSLGDYIPTDFYYAQLSSSFSASDCDAEIAVGRIPMYNNNYSITDDILERMINYENVGASDIEWRHNALFAGVYLDNQTSGSGIFEIIRNDILSPNGWNCYRIYADGIGYPDEIGCSYAKFPNAWNSDSYGLVEWSTHGQKDDADKILYSSATSTLSDEYPPIVFSASCQNAWVEVSNNLAYSLLKNAAISVVAPTRNSMYLPGQNAEIANLGTNQGYTIEFARGIVEDSMGVGDALNAVKSWSTVQQIQLWTNYCDFNVYGCPEIGVYSQGAGVSIGKTLITKEYVSINYLNNNIEFKANENLLIKMEIFNIQGKKFFQRNIKTVEGLNRLSLKNYIANGTYFGTITVEGNKRSFSFIKN